MDYQIFNKLYTSTLNLLLSLAPRYFQNQYKDQSISQEYFAFLEKNPKMKARVITLLQETKQYLESGLKGTRDESIVLNRIRGIVSELNSFNGVFYSGGLTLWEDSLWTLENFKYGINLDCGITIKDPLIISHLVLVEHCLLGCNFCSIDAPTKGERMYLGLLHELRKSRSILFAQELHLGVGEVLLYPNLEIFDVLQDMLLHDKFGIPNKITLTTAGLVIPENKKNGEAFIRALSKLGTKCTVFVSFNLLNPAARKNKIQYLRDIRRTIELILNTGATVKPQLMHLDEEGPFDKTRTFEAYMSIMREVPVFGPILKAGETAVSQVMHRFNRCSVDPTKILEASRYVMSELPILDAKTRTVGAVGRARKNYPDIPIVHKVQSDCAIYSGQRSRLFGVLPNGDLATGCLAPGGLGAIFGNVYENDVMQIMAARMAFAEQFKPTGDHIMEMSICDLHRTCGVKFKLPKSKRPIVAKRWKPKRSKIAV